MERVNGYVEFYDEGRSYGEWERCAEFKYSDDAILFAKACYQANPRHSYRAVRCHTEDQYGANGVTWHSDTERDKLYASIKA